MAYIFGGANLDQHNRRPGRMKVFVTGAPARLTFSMAGWAAGASAQNAVLSGVSANTQGNYQFLLTMRNYTYVYVFGEKMGDIVVSGIAALECGETLHGLTYAMDYYNANRLGFTGAPIALQFATYIVNAFLVGGSFQYMNPKSRLAKFQFKFKTIVDPS